MSGAVNIIPAANAAVACQSGRPHRLRNRSGSMAIDPSSWRSPQHVAVRGLYRVYEPPHYILHGANGETPSEADAPLATVAALPHTVADTLSDGDWQFSVAYHNGVLSSGLGVVHSAAIVGGEQIAKRPQSPYGSKIVQTAGGVCVLLSHYSEPGLTRADSWAIAYAIGGALPTADAPDIVIPIPAVGAVALAYPLPAQPHGTTMHVIIQVRRTGVPTSVYSRGHTILSLTVDNEGPSSPPAASAWPGHPHTQER